MHGGKLLRPVWVVKNGYNVSTQHMGFFRRLKNEKDDGTWKSSAERATDHLDVILSEQVQDTADAHEQSASVDTAVLPEAPVRERIRILRLTTDLSLFTPGSASAGEYIALSSYLDEVHIVVLTLRRDGSYIPLRLAPNVWVYPTNSRSNFFALCNAYRIARKQMAFASGFRADIIVADEAAEAGMAGYALARRYGRPLQLHLSVDPFENGYEAERDGNHWRVLSARFLIPRAACVLSRSKRLQGVLQRRYPKRAEDISMLPVFRDLALFRDSKPAFDLRVRYPHLKFIILMVSRLDRGSHADRGIYACTPILQQYPTMGLVIVGDGPERASLRQKVAAAHLDERVLFEPASDDLVSPMRSANLFLSVSVSEEQDGLLVAAAASGLPVLAVAGGMTDTLFEDGVNGFVCPEHDVVCLQARIGEFLNDNQLRKTFSINARDQVFSVMGQDVDTYRREFIGGLERCVVKTYTGDAKKTEL